MQRDRLPTTLNELDLTITDSGEITMRRALQPYRVGAALNSLTLGGRSYLICGVARGAERRLRIRRPHSPGTVLATIALYGFNLACALGILWLIFVWKP